MEPLQQSVSPQTKSNALDNLSTTIGAVGGELSEKVTPGGTDVENEARKVSQVAFIMTNGSETTN